MHTTSFASSTTVNVMWNPPAQPNGVITGYIVMYSVYERNDFTSSVMLEGSVTTYLIDGLSKYSVHQYVSLTALSTTAAGTPYQARVVAYTSAGRGEENSLMTFFSQELEPRMPPGNVSFDRSRTSLNVSWTPLTLFQARGFPVYRVSLVLRSNSRIKRQAIVPVITNNSFAVFSGLSGNTQYDAAVGVSTGATTEFNEVVMPGNISVCVVALYITSGVFS